MGQSRSRAVEVHGERYKIGRVLGKGSFGKVFVLLRKDPQTRTLKILAMKQMDKRAIIERNVIDNMLNEKVLLIELKDSPFILQVLRTFQTEDDLCMIMPYMAGGDLRYHLITHNRFQEDQVRFYASQIVLGIECLHKNGIIHRDIKPDNLLVDEEGYCYIADLNVSIKAEEVNNRAGTSRYMAPEVISQKTYTSKADWWSLGITLYELLSGRVPFEDANGICCSTLLFPRRIQFSDQAKSLLRGLLEKFPEKRIDVDEIKAHPFFQGVDWENLPQKTAKAPFIPDKTKAHCTPDPEFEEVFGSSKKKTWKLSVEQQSFFKNWDWEESPEGTSSVRSNMYSNSLPNSLYEPSSAHSSPRLNDELFQTQPSVVHPGRQTTRILQTKSYDL